MRCTFSTTVHLHIVDRVCILEKRIMLVIVCIGIEDCASDMPTGSWLSYFVFGLSSKHIYVCSCIFVSSC